MKQADDPSQNVSHLPVAHQQGERHDLAIYDPYLNPYVPEEEGLDLRQLWNVIVKYRWTILSVAGVVLTTTIIATLLMRPVFRATTLVEVRPETNIVRFQTVQQQLRRQGEYLETQVKILYSDSVAKAVIDKLSLETHPEIGGDVTERGFRQGIKKLFAVFYTAPDEGSKMQESQVEIDPALVRETWFIKRFKKKLNIKPIKTAALVEVSFDSFDRKLVAQVANAVVDEYIHFNDQRRFNSTAGAKTFLKEEIKQVQARLETSEKELTQFARENNIVDVEEKSNIMSERIIELNKKLTEIHARRLAAEQTVKYIRKSGIETIPWVFNENELIANLKSEYARLQGQYLKFSRIYKDAYPKLQQVKAERDQIKKSLDKEIQSIAKSRQVLYDQYVDGEQALRESLEKERASFLDLKDRAIQYNILKRGWETNKELYSALLERIKEIGVAAGMEISNISIIDRAKPPVRHHKPSLQKNALLALGLGLAGGVAFAFGLAFLDNTVRNSDEVEKVAAIPSLGMVPKLVEEKLVEDSISEGIGIDLMSHLKRDNPVSEAYRSIRTSLMFSSPEGAPKVLQITSAVPGEGKTTAVINLGCVLAQNGASVLIVDADLRRPRIHKAFGLPSSPGLSEHLTGNHQEAIHTTEVPSLSVMACGTVPPNPAELLGSQNMDTFLKAMEKMFDYVILDSPPIMGLADALITSTKVKGVMLIISAGSVSKDALREAVKRLRNVRAPLLGGTLNLVDMKSREYSSYSHYYYNYSDKEENQKRFSIGSFRKKRA